MDEPQATPKVPPSPLGNILDRVLSDPALMSKGESQSQAPLAEEAAPQSESQPSPLRDGLGALLSNPGFLQALPGVMAMLQPMMQAPPSPSAPSKSAPPPSHRDNLLLALKPFLSSDRQRAVDTILRLSRLGAVFHQLQ